MLRRTSDHINGRLWLLLGLWLCSCGALLSQTVVLQLRNGDRLTGKLLSETTNHVVISTGWAKELRIPLAEITKRESSTLIAVTNTVVHTNILGAVPITTTNTTITLTNATPNLLGKTVPPTAKGPQRWHGELQIGTDLGFSEKNRQLYYGRFKFTYGREMAPHRFFKNTFDFNSTYGRTDGITSANQLTSSSKTDVDLTKRVFVYNLAGVGYDEIRKIDFQFEVGPGFGYHVLMLSNFVMNAEFGMNYQAQYFNNQKTLERYFYRLAEDAKWVITSKLSFDEKFEFFPVEDLQQFRLRFESNLRYTFIEKFIFTLTLLETYDTQPAIGVAPNDLQIRSTLGLKF